MPYVGRVPSAVPVTADDIPANSIDASKIIDGAIAVADVADNAITEAKIADAAVVSLKSGRKNLIINGGFDVWQRGTSVATTSSAYGADRWTSGTNADITFSQQSFTVGQTDVPNEPAYYLRANKTGTDDDMGMVQHIEDVRTFAGKTVTLSFFVKGDSTYTGQVKISQDFGSGGSTTVTSTAQTINLTTSWQKIIYTITLPSISGKTIGSGSNLSMIIKHSTAAAAGVFDIAQVQFEAGSVATDFEHRSYGEELALCQRYYEVLGSTAVTDYGFMYIGGNWTTVNSRWGLQWTVTKRASPTITESGTWYVRNSTGSSIAVTAKNFDQPSPYGAAPYVTCASGLTVGHTAQIWGDDGLIKVDAEL